MKKKSIKITYDCTDGINEKGGLLISVIILNYNGLHLLKRFLPSVLNQDFPKEVIVVDNGSTDGSKDFLKGKVRLLSLRKNRGISEGFNIGILYAKGDYVLLTANDLKFDSQVLKTLSKHTEGITTTKIYKMDGRLDNMGSGMDFLGFPIMNFKSKKPFASCGGSLYVKRSLALKLKWDSKYFIMNDDIDFSWRARLLGHKVRVEPKAIMYHLGDVTLDKEYSRARKRFYSEKNILRTLLKNYSLGYLTFVLPVYFSLLIAEIIFFCLWRKWAIVKSLFESMKWNIENLSGTLERRREIQRLRKVSDWEIFKLMSKVPHKITLFIDFLFNREKWKDYA